MWQEGPKTKFHEAIIVMEEICGEAHTIYLLEEELQRRRVVKQYRENRRELLAAEVREADLARKLDEAREALEFYGNGDNYEARGNRPSAIQKDKGHAARNALAAIDPDEDDEDKAEDE